MKPSRNVFRECLLDLDVKKARRVWNATFPDSIPPGDDKTMLATLHMARTTAESLPLKYRAWSHCWLKDNGLPSQLPDHLKPSAERMYPREVSSVGVAVMSSLGIKNERAKHIEKAMSDAVAECYADGVTDVDVIKNRMKEARVKAEA